MQATDDDLRRLLEGIVTDWKGGIRVEPGRPGRPTMLAVVRMNERLDLADDAIAQLPGHFARLSKLEDESGATAQVAAVASAMDPRALAGLQQILDKFGVGAVTRATPTVGRFLADTYTSEKKLQDDARRHIDGYVRLFTRAAGDKPLADYTRADILKWVRNIEKLRTSYGKRKGDDAKTIKQLLKESVGEPTLNTTTVEKHITHIRALFLAARQHYRWCSQDDIKDMFQKIELSDHVPDARLRKPWTTAQLGALLRSPIWTGTRSRRDDRTHRHEPGPQIHRDAYWWLPIAALWTGARLEELAQLHHEDIDKDRNNIPFIRIHDEGDRQLKNQHSVRNVPVHSFLQSIGFLDLFRSKAHGRIWPELKQHGRPPRWGALYSSHFTDYRRECELYESLRDFHSLRRTFVTHLRIRGKVDALTVAAIVGHDDSDPELRKVQQTNDYTDYDCEALRDAIECLDYAVHGLDVGTLKRTAAICGPRDSMRIEKRDIVGMTAQS
jgi:integrase